MITEELLRQQDLPTIDLKHILPTGLSAPHPGLKTRCELDKNLSAAHKSIEKISGEKEWMTGHNGYFLPDC